MLSKLSKYCGLILAPLLLIETSLYAAPTEKQVLSAMQKASDFLANKVANRGGYVWVYSPDLSKRYGELPARPTQIWAQGATPEMGMVFLDAYKAIGDERYLVYAKKAANALIWGQHPLGGWHYLIDFDMSGLEQWYRDVFSKCKWGTQEYYHYYGNCTFDNDATAGPTRFLLALYMTPLDPAYREPLLKALDFILMAQYPDGGWPQRYPLRYEFVHEGLPDYTSNYTYNDGVIINNINLLFRAYEQLGNEEYRKAEFIK